jgi:hypothetical protein
VNLKVWWETGIIQPLDLTTTERVFTQVSTMLFLTAKYKVSENPNFNGARESKNTVMRNAKKNHKMGLLDHQAHPLSRAQLNYLLHSDTLSFSQPFPLIADFYVNFCIWFLPRVRLEMYNMRRGEIHLVYGPHGQPMYAFYCPFSAFKTNQGTANPTGEYGSFTIKTAAAVPVPSIPKLCPFRVIGEVFKHLDMLPFSGKGLRLTIMTALIDILVNCT